jgi:hypothetical protein
MMHVSENVKIIILYVQTQRGVDRDDDDGNNNNNNNIIIIIIIIITPFFHNRNRLFSSFKWMLHSQPSVTLVQKT